MDSEQDIYQRIERQVSLLIRRADITKAVDNMILDRSAYFLLAQLHHDGPQTISSLANTFLLDISTVSRQTTALESKELVERVHDPESIRVSLLQITSKGTELYLEMRDKRAARYEEMLSHWSEEERVGLSDYLTRLNEAIDIKAKRWLKESRS
ncbi:MarR family transcriptional regulator [Alicyclobacillus fastidiosus]|uniref:MarR family transcriptional regulator n=1 Tax=Alicyclobacillus fastidiosus TaxID=392011 RepID=A0ABY6ZKR1_9BACL|nr:MarR family transcriptional regulator [Alicyclobacillus fastidiosus]WAH42701.1 MarR family transcriptional regulator [Alicyclobacillus fastidiosus]GMA64589.1 putative HTH-type transcriptional regulator YxaD [Alicyclobacillus fastidiosus]